MVPPPPLVSVLLEELLPQPTLSTAVSKVTLAPSANRRNRKNQSTESLLSMVIPLIVVFEFRGAVFATALHVAARTSKRVGSADCTVSGITTRMVSVDPVMRRPPSGRRAERHRSGGCSARRGNPSMTSFGLCRQRRGGAADVAADCRSWREVLSLA